MHAEGRMRFDENNGKWGSIMKISGLSLLGIMITVLSLSGCGGDHTFEAKTSLKQAGTASPVFSNRQDCRAVILNSYGLCQTNDCRAVIQGNYALCRSNDCRAMVQGIFGLCGTRDCKAVLTRNLGLCDSGNCRAVITRVAANCQ